MIQQENAHATVHWLSPEEERQWDAFVTGHPLGCVYHLSAWKRVLEEAFPHIRGRFLALRDGVTGQIRAGMPLYTVRSWLLGNRIVSVPFASSCDPLISAPEEFALLLPAIQDALRGAGGRTIEIRAITTAQHLAASPLAADAIYKHHYLALDRSPEALFNSFANSSVRQKVRKARRLGVTVEERTDEEGMRICHAILTDTRRRISLPPMPFAFFRAMRRRLGPDHLKVYLAMQEGKAVACHLVLRFKDRWNSEYSGNTNSAITGANQLLYWDAIQRAQASGAQRFSLGRTSPHHLGLLSYKQRWAPVEEDLTHFTNALGNGSRRSIAGVEARSATTVYRLLQPLVGKAPMWFLRLVGTFCYRHLG